MDFRDPSAALPPALAARRSHKLKEARKLGIHHARFNKPGRGQRLPFPDVPVHIPIKGKAEKVEYQLGKVGVTKEQRAYFDDVTDEAGEGTDWSTAEIGEEVPGLEAGRIVEVRR